MINRICPVPWRGLVLLKTQHSGNLHGPASSRYRKSLASSYFNVAIMRSRTRDRMTSPKASRVNAMSSSVWAEEVTPPV